MTLDVPVTIWWVRTPPRDAMRVSSDEYRDHERELSYVLRDGRWLIVSDACRDVFGAPPWDLEMPELRLRFRELGS